MPGAEYKNMNIYSWNMLFRNRELDRAFEFITRSDFDIFCLQEVPEAFLERLQTLPYFIDSHSDFISYRSDVERLFKHGTTERNFVVTLSKHPIATQGEIFFQDYWLFLPWRTRIFVKLMWPFYFSKISNRGGLYTDVSIKGVPMRVFNLHLILAHPEWRLKEFEMAMTNRDRARLSIVCGDFNIIESPRVSILNWLLGGSFTDAFFYRRERMHIEKRFIEHELVNPLRGKKTHSFAWSQLDHILVSKSFSIKKAEVISDRFGSDHHPIRVEIK